ncbi:MAG TPA: vWA domain-containing protein [Polyangiaceae bacterium]|nr:vWA domain-containing protein [Polyangiaceae bacterium]
MARTIFHTSLALAGCALLGCSGVDGSSESGTTIGDGFTPGTGAGDGSGRSTGSSGPGLVVSPPSAGASATASDSSSGSPSSTPAVTPTPGGTGTGNGTVGRSILTAGAWDDNRNFDFFLDYRKTRVAAQTPGLLTIPDDAYSTANVFFSQPASAKSTLDISLVIDTTGSMGDEIKYLQSEFITLANTISERYPNAAQHWSLVLYKDVTDPYIVKWFDFRADPLEFQTKLDLASADGGGDFPEAPDQALAKAALLDWRSDPTTARLAFWVADAPHHALNAGALSDAVLALQERKVHVYPVASSGVDDFTELTMRSVAQLTGGRYLFLTNDSGVGGDHKEPTVPCYFVTKLDRAILRMVDIELSGAYREPNADEVLRTGGSPENGACTLESGQVVTIY